MTGTAVARPKCGKKTRSGGTCKNVAGKRTDHVGEGPCYLHGGLTPIKHGRYSKITRERIRDLIQEHHQDPEPLDVLPELAAARALFQDFIERYDEWRDALLLWWAAQTGRKSPLEHVRFAADVVLSTDPEYSPKARELASGILLADAAPRQILDVADAYRIVSEITKIVKRIEDTRAQNAISRKDFLRIMTEMGRVVDLAVDDDRVREKIRDGWAGIALA